MFDEEIFDSMKRLNFDSFETENFDGSRDTVWESLV
jgi:hypothetical protein